MFIELPGGLPEKIPFEESIVDRRVPVLDHFIESARHGRQPQPRVSDNLKVLVQFLPASSRAPSDAKSS